MKKRASSSPDRHQWLRQYLPLPGASSVSKVHDINIFPAPSSGILTGSPFAPAQPTEKSETHHFIQMRKSFRQTKQKQNRETKKEGAKRSNPASHYHRCAAAVAAATQTVVVPVCLPACLAGCLPPDANRNRTENIRKRERNVAIQPVITTACCCRRRHSNCCSSLPACLPAPRNEQKQNRETKKEGAKRSNPASHYHRCAAAVAAATQTVVVPVCLPAAPRKQGAQTVKSHLDCIKETRGATTNKALAAG